MTAPILLLGARGFAGRHFLADAGTAGHAVVTAARPGSDGDVAADLLDPESVERAVAESEPGAIVNLAGSASVAESWNDPLAAFAANTAGAVHVLEAARKRAPEALVVLASSGDVYGEVEPALLPIVEATPVQPRSPYAASKAAMEVLAGQYERSHGSRVAIARAFNHTGPGQSDRFAASSFARQIAEAEREGAGELKLKVGNLSLERDFTDVRDTVRAYRMLIEHEITGTYNVCSGHPTPLERLVETLAEATEVEIAIEVDESRLRSGEPAVIFGSHAAITERCGWEPERPLTGAVTGLLDSWREKLA